MSETAIVAQELSQGKGDLARLYQEESGNVKALTPDLIESITEGVKKGLTPQDACAIVRVPESKFEEWYVAGRALLEGSEAPGIPSLVGMRDGESKDEYDIRKREWLGQCDLLAQFYLLANQARSSLSNDMLGVIREYAMAEQYDSWKAADRYLRITGTQYDPDKKQQHTHQHVVSGSVEHRETPATKTHAIVANILSVSGTHKEAPIIIEGEVIEK